MIRVHLKYLKSMKIVKGLLLIYIMAFFSCAPSQRPSSISKKVDNSRPIAQNPILQAVLWYQLSGEYKALTFQTYHFAEGRFNELWEKHSINAEKPLAIITDLDETVLDNSPFFAKMILTGSEYNSKDWAAWTEREDAKILPGAYHFLTAVAKQGVEIFYVSNRNEIELKATLNNLRKHGLPFADKNHILLRGKTGDKEPRRGDIQKTHEIIMLLGDNLSDFSNDFDIPDNENRNQAVENQSHFFGDKFIVFPNPIYGNWEKDGLLNGHYDWNKVEKDSIRLSKLISY